MPDRHSELVEEAAKELAIRRLEGARWKQYRPDAQAAAKPFLEELEQLRARAERAEAEVEREREWRAAENKAAKEVIATAEGLLGDRERAQESDRHRIRADDAEARAERYKAERDEAYEDSRRSMERLNRVLPTAERYKAALEEIAGLEGSTRRRYVTLTQIIEQARRALTQPQEEE